MTIVTTMKNLLPSWLGGATMKDLEWQKNENLRSLKELKGWLSEVINDVETGVNGKPLKIEDSEDNRIELHVGQSKIYQLSQQFEGDLTIHVVHVKKGEPSGKVMPCSDFQDAKEKFCTLVATELPSESAALVTGRQGYVAEVPSMRADG